MASDVLGSELGSDVVMLSLRDGMYYGLEDAGADIWRLIQKTSTIADIVRSLVDAYDVAPEQCREDVLNLIASLRDRGLVEVHER